MGLTCAHRRDFGDIPLAQIAVECTGILKHCKGKERACQGSIWRKCRRKESDHCTRTCSDCGDFGDIPLAKVAIKFEGTSEHFKEVESVC